MVYRANCRHCRALEDFEAARAAWWALRESGAPAGGFAAGTAHSNAGWYQLSDEEFREVHPPPRLRDFLEALRDEREDGQERYGA